MTKRRTSQVNGEDIITKISILLNQYKRDEPAYMKRYMEIKRGREALPPHKKTELEKDAEKLLRTLGEALNFK